ncbi:MAG: trypsin-like serine protease [Streptosporangiaceae bacterium]|nr:trypsin-like serine protease [Streptosporangiaceae bacterium]MBV9856640.1 trypsin-like serine protease [Streptosporangiaceae bacterium]
MGWLTRGTGRHGRKADSAATDLAGVSGDPAGDSGERWPGERWLGRPSGRLAVTAALATLAIVMIPPANGAATGAATDIVHRLARAVGHFVSRSHAGQGFGGTAAVGALFTTQNGKLSQHFCTASVVHSPAGDLAVTAAHCVTGVGSSIAFVPDYDNGKDPFGVWQVTHVYTDKAWQSSASADDDFAFLQVSPTSQSSPIEDITGAEQLGTRGQSHALVRVIGYPDNAGQPVVCDNWTESFGSTQLEFDCGGYANGTSGGPFLAAVSSSSGQGIVIGVIGGYQQGGDTPSVSYSAVFGPRVAALYQAAIASG